MSSSRPSLPRAVKKQRNYYEGGLSRSYQPDRSGFRDPESAQQVLREEVVASGMNPQIGGEILQARQNFQRRGMPDSVTREMIEHVANTPADNRTAEDQMMLDNPHGGLAERNINRNHTFSNSSMATLTASTLAQAARVRYEERGPIQEQFTALSEIISGSSEHAEIASEAVFSALDHVESMADNAEHPGAIRADAVRAFGWALDTATRHTADQANNLGFGGAQPNQDVGSAIDPHILPDNSYSPRSGLTVNSLRKTPLLSPRMRTAMTTPAVRLSTNEAVYSKR